MKFVRSRRSTPKVRIGRVGRRGRGRIPGYLGSRAARVEVKAVDTPNNSVQLTSTAGVVALNTIATGADVWQRVGRQIMLQSVHVRAYLQNSGNPEGNEQIRFAIVYDRQPDGVAPVWADVFQNQDNTGAATSDSWAYTNTSNWNRFKILAEDLLAPETAGGGTVVASAVNDQFQHLIFDRYVKLSGLVTRYVAGAAAVPNSGAIFFMFKGLYAAMSNPYVINYSARVTYTDV